MSGLDYHVSIAMQKALPLLAGLIAQAWAILRVAERVAPTRISRLAHARVLRLIRPAEALVRRLIALLAEKVHSTPLPPQRPHVPIRPAMVSGAEPEGPGAAAPQPETPTFALYEFMPSFVRHYLEGETTPVPQSGFGPPAPTCNPGRLIARLEALQQAIDNRHAIALRLARSTPRKIARNSAARVTPWRLGWPPGGKSAHTEPWLADMLSLFMMAIRRIPPPQRPQIAI
ncbi:hypothetical protein WNY37_02115 [Henriciella sp. AS95]|uniref:hypothetical protein n=1 Tax=Henriciella sp. AS95 TaxID=3135782 RepID=UPI0031717C3D